MDTRGVKEDMPPHYCQGTEENTEESTEENVCRRIHVCWPPRYTVSGSVKATIKQV